MTIVDCDKCSECGEKTTLVVFCAYSGTAGICANCVTAGASALLEEWGNHPLTDYDPCAQGGDDG